MSIEDRIAEIRRMEKEMPRMMFDKVPAEPWGVYTTMPRSCTLCESNNLINDGRYYCVRCHPDYRDTPCLP